MARFVRYVFAAVGLAFGVYGVQGLLGLLRNTLGQDFTGREGLALLVIGGSVGAVVFFILGPVFMRAAGRWIGWVQGRLFKAPAQDIVAGAAGLITGLIIAFLMRSALTPLPIVGAYLPVAASLVLAYLGWVVGVHKREDLPGLLHLLPRAAGREREAGISSPKILDTSAIIDGRIADIFRTGFIEGTVIVPAFVLDELRHIADSGDTLKRARGRRGLDILNRLREEAEVPVRVYERDPGGDEVDVKLTKLAKKLNGKVVTNDFNLSKVATLQGIAVLNVNDLANAVKPQVLPGEIMEVQVIKDGKESGQGVGYLEDGTMIVIDGGRRHIGETIHVEVTSVIQTSAGRMIFARPRAAADAEKAPVSHT